MSTETVSAANLRRLPDEMASQILGGRPYYTALYVGSGSLWGASESGYMDRLGQWADDATPGPESITRYRPVPIRWKGARR